MTISYDFKRAVNSSGEFGQNLFLIGTSTKGPYMEPVLVTSPENAEKVFGSLDKGNLVKAFNQAYSEDRDIPIYLMRIGCTPSTLTLSNPYDDTLDLLYFEVEDVTDDFEVTLEFRDAKITDDEYKKYAILHTSKGYIYYELNDHMNVNELSRLVNRDYRDGIHSIKCSAIDPNCMVSYLYEEYEQQVLSFIPGNDGTEISKNYTYLELELAYDILQGRNVDVIVPVEAFIDDIHPVFLYAGDSYYGSAVYESRSDYLSLLDTENDDQPVTFHEQLIEFCRRQTLLGCMSLGIMGFRPMVKVPDSIAYDNSYITRILDMTAFRRRTGFIDYVNGRFYDKGFYLLPVGSELIYRHGDTEYHDNGYVRYAALAASTFETTTNMMIGDDVELRYELSNQTRSDLSRLGIVTFRKSVRKGLVVQSGVTAASEETDYHTLANVRMVQLTIVTMNSVIDHIRSQEYTDELLRRYIETSLGEALLSLKESGVLTEYGLQINWLSDGSQGEIIIAIKSKYMIESIQINSLLGESTEGMVLDGTSIH